MAEHRNTLETCRKYKAKKNLTPNQMKSKRAYWDATRERVKEMQSKASEIKITAGCADCGYREHAIALDFDHLPGNPKVRSVCELIYKARPWEEILAEIAKCEVVCANCHRVRTQNKGQSSPNYQVGEPELVKAKTEKAVCPVCDKNYTFYWSTFPNGKQHCSDVCERVAKVQSHRYKANCLYCGVEFEHPNNRKQQFCSRKCSSNHRAEQNPDSPFHAYEATCEQCQKVFKVIGNRKGRFCSSRCFGDSMKGQKRTPIG